MIVSDNQLFNQQQAAEHASQTAAAAVQESASENNNDRKSVVTSGKLKIIIKFINQAIMNHRSRKIGRSGSPWSPDLYKIDRILS